MRPAAAAAAVAAVAASAAAPAGSAGGSSSVIAQRPHQAAPSALRPRRRRLAIEWLNDTSLETSWWPIEQAKYHPGLDCNSQGKLRPSSWSYWKFLPSRAPQCHLRAAASLETS